MKKYKTSLLMLEDNFDILKTEVYIFAFKSKKKAGIQARYVLSNIKKICHSLRKEINDDLKALPKPKRNISQEAIDAAKIKRRITMEYKRVKNKPK